MTQPMEGFIVEPDYELKLGSGEDLFSYKEPDPYDPTVVEASHTVWDGEHGISLYVGSAAYEYGTATLPMEVAVKLAKSILAEAGTIDA